MLRCCLPAALAAIALAAAGCGGSGGGSAGASSAPAAGEFAGNAVRVAGRSPADVAANAVLAAYPPGKGVDPKGWVVVPGNDWRQVILGAQFAGSPLAAGVLPTEHDFLPTATQDLLTRMKPSGFPLSHGIQTLLIGSAGQDVLSGLHDRHLDVAQLKAHDPSALALKLVPYRGGFAHAFSGEVVVVSDEDRDYALPAAAWSAYSGDSLAFTGRDRIPAATRALLVQRKKLKAEKPTIYVAGPPSVISNRVAGELRQYGPVKRVGAAGPVENAIAFARYRDPKTGFGWGLTRGPASVSIVNASDWGDAIGAFDLAAAGPQAPLLLTTSASALPPHLVSYLQTLRGAKANHGFVFGDRTHVSSAALQRLAAALAPKAPGG